MKRSAAVCSWLARIDETRIIQHVGIVPGKQRVEIVPILAKLNPGP